MATSARAGWISAPAATVAAPAGRPGASNGRNFCYGCPFRARDHFSESWRRGGPECSRKFRKKQLRCRFSELSCRAPARDRRGARETSNGARKLRTAVIPLAQKKIRARWYSNSVPFLPALKSNSASVFFCFFLTEKIRLVASFPKSGRTRETDARSKSYGRLKLPSAPLALLQ